MFGNVYEDKTVLITGHSGFKGSWLALWLKELKANIVGYSLNPPSIPYHYELLNLNIVSLFGDIRNKEKLAEAVETYKPEIVFHLAAQPLVRQSYREPAYTFETNIMGTINVFEACRLSKSVKAIVNVTSDKCYENKEWVWGYRENDAMGGYDPYSSSKGCAELITNSYRNSFFNPNDHGRLNQVLLASARAGNVIGGGDWGADRLIPDIVRAASKNDCVLIRSPNAIRPWQHVLEPLSGYLLLGQKLLEGEKEFAEGWNFGPLADRNITVIEAVDKIKERWNKVRIAVPEETKHLHEASSLRLECSKAYAKLKWQNVWDSQKTFDKTADWYKKYYEQKLVCSEDDLHEYLFDAKIKNISWLK